MRIKDILIGIAIMILTFLVIYAGIQTFYPRPEYDDFCGDYKTPTPIIKNDSAVCATDVMQCPDGSYVSRNPDNNCEFYDCEDDYQACYEKYDEARKAYSKNLFIITLILGIIVLGIGAILFNLEAVGGGIMGGGVITLIYGAGAYWPNAENLFRFIIAIIGLVVVVSFAYWINRRK